MRKFILSILLLLSFATSSFAEFGGSPFGLEKFGTVAFGVGRFGESTSMVQQLQAIGGLTFFKDYRENKASLNADFSVGSPTATYNATRSASAPATYVDGTGVIQLLTTSDVRRRQGGYYDATGFHVQSGEMIETPAENLVPKSKVFNDATWTASNLTPADNEVLSPDGTTNAASLTATAANGSLLLATSVTAQTFSVWLKRKTGTGTVKITANGGTNWTEVTLTTSWRRFQETRASASQKCGIQIVTDTDAVYVWGAQFEDWPHATSFVPTTSVARTRPAETLKYVISGNRTAAIETMIVKFASDSNFANDGKNRYLLATDTKNRLLYKVSNLTTVKGMANSTDSSAAHVTSTSSLLGNTSYIVAVVMYGETAATNMEIYFNGVSEATDADNYTANAWGTSFYVGDSVGGGDHLNGIVQSVVFYNRALSAPEVVLVGSILNNGSL